jgi:phage tail-like protein
MSNPEFKFQTLHSLAQWNTCVGSRLRIGKNGIELFSAPAFDRFLKPIQSVRDLATSTQGEIFWAAQVDGIWQLIRRLPCASMNEVLLSLSSCGVTGPRRLWWTGRHLWVLDSSSENACDDSSASQRQIRRGRLLSFSLDTYQITREIQVSGEFLDAGIQAGPCTETVYVLVKHDNRFEVHVYPCPPGPESCFTSPLWKVPAALAVTKDGTVFILDTALERFLRFANGNGLVLGDQPQSQLKNFPPDALEVDPDGGIYVASSGRLKLFDREGSFLMEVKLPAQNEASAKAPAIKGMGFDGAGGFYLATDAGIAIFALSKVPVAVPGRLYLPAFDNGKVEGTWHGLAISTALPAKSGLEIAYYASDSAGLKAAYDRVLASTVATEEKAAQIESLLKPLWQNDTGNFTGSGSGSKPEPLNTLLVANQGRYLWLRATLTAYDAASHPTISEIKISYPRVSLLRYLPAVYQENRVSAAFLERFLALFETVFQEVDTTITDLYRYFDPASTPPEFLSWLASWLSLTLDDSLPEDRKRRLINMAPTLFQTKGTPAGIQIFLSTYTGVPVEVREPSLLADPFTLGTIHLGQQSMLSRKARGVAQLGHNTVLGETLLVAKDTAPASPLAAVANRIEITFDMQPAQFATAEPIIRSALRASVPASTDYVLRLASTQSTLGLARLGLNTRLPWPQPFQVGVTPLGSGQALTHTFNHDHPPSRLERGAAISPDWRLTE